MTDVNHESDRLTVETLEEDSELEISSFAEGLDRLLLRELAEQEKLGGQGDSIRSLAEKLGFEIVSNASEAKEPESSIIVPTHFSEREKNHRIARAIAWPTLKNLIVEMEDVGAPACMEAKDREVLRGLHKDMVLDLLAAALLIPTSAFVKASEDILYDAGKLRIRLRLHLA